MSPRLRKDPLRKEAGDYHHGNLRRALLEAAIQLLEEGDDAFTMREAARRVGVDHRAAYKHFVDRDDVLAAVSTEAYLALVDAVRTELARIDETDGTARLLGIARAYLAFSARAPGRYRLMTGSRLNDDGRFPDLEAAIDTAFRLVKHELESGMKRGVFAEADVLERTITLWASMHGMASLVIMRRIRVRRDLLPTFAERTIGCTIRGMLNK